VRPPALLTSLAVLAVALTAPAAAALPAAAAAPAGPAAVVRPQRAVAANSCGPALSDALTETPWPLRRLQPAQAWQFSRGAGVVVAVLDSGVSDQHPKLAGKLTGGHDYTGGGTDATCDQVGHGTFVAAIIAGRDTTDAPFTGVAPDARIMPMRVLAQENTQNTNEPAIVAQAIRDAITLNVGVINLSLVIRNPTQELADAVQSALNHRIVVVAAAGNEGASANNGQPIFPAAYPGVIAVAATDQQDHRLASSSTGSYVSVAAPGGDIIGPAPRGGGYGRLEQGGTSFAAAYVSGLAALLKAYDPSLSSAQVKARIERTADHPPQGRNDQVGYGVVNPIRALTTVFGSARTPGPAQTGAVMAPADMTDPDAWRATAAGWATAGALLLALLILVAAPLLRRGRARHWRPGRAARDEVAGPARRGDEFAPVIGRTVSITAPVNRRTAAPQTPAGVRASGLPGHDAARGRRP
jgi:membrane-anchored mycosin MYCP